VEQMSQNELVETIRSIEHPEIANTLNELGMIGDINQNHEEKTISVTLVLPMMTIPIEIRDMLINSIAEGIKQKAKGYKLKISLDQMEEETKQKFFVLSKQNWKL